MKNGASIKRVQNVAKLTHLSLMDIVKMCCLIENQIKKYKMQINPECCCLLIGIFDQQRNNWGTVNPLVTVGQIFTWTEQLQHTPTLVCLAATTPWFCKKINNTFFVHRNIAHPKKFRPLKPPLKDNLFATGIELLFWGSCSHKHVSFHWYNSHGDTSFLSENWEQLAKMDSQPL